MKVSDKQKTIPTFSLILGYEQFYETPPPKDRLKLIANIGKMNLLIELSALNYRLKPNDTMYWDESIEAQIKEIEYFCRFNDNLCKHYVNKFQILKQNKSKYPFIFTRQTCIYAMEEIIQSNLEVNETFRLSSAEHWKSIFDYILLVNSDITKYVESEKDQSSFENINPQLLPLNELNVSVDQIYVPFRGYKLIKFLTENIQTKEEINKYFLETYSSSPNYFLYELIRMHMANRHENPKLNFCHTIPDKHKRFYEMWSQKYPSKDVEKLLSIKKYPYFKISNNQYILVDNVLLIEKAYSQFINDFWFDWLKDLKDHNGKYRFNIKIYKSIIGHFFENYVKETFHYSFVNTNKYFITKYFDELKIKINGKETEVSDLYIRYNNKIIIGEVKSTSIYDNEKLGKTIESLYKKDRNEFFDNFGVGQVVNAIQNMNEKLPFVDEKFLQLKRYTVFPVVILNEKAMQTPFMAKLMQERFKELMKDYKQIKVEIFPLITIHISDLEHMQDILHKSPNEIWSILKFHSRNPEFMPPFYNTLIRKNIKPTYESSRPVFDNLIDEFSMEGEV